MSGDVSKNETEVYDPKLQSIALYSHSNGTAWSSYLPKPMTVLQENKVILLASLMQFIGLLSRTSNSITSYFHSQLIRFQNTFPAHLTSSFLFLPNFIQVVDG